MWHFKKFYELNFLFCLNINPRFLGLALPTAVKLTYSWREMALVSIVKGSVLEGSIIGTVGMLYPQ